MSNDKKPYRPPSPVSIATTPADSVALSDIEALEAQLEKIKEQIKAAQKTRDEDRQAKLIAEEALKHYGFMDRVKATKSFLAAKERFDETNETYKQSQIAVEQLLERKKVIDDMLLLLKSSTVDEATGEYISTNYKDSQEDHILSIYELHQGRWQDALIAAKAEKKQIEQWIDELEQLKNTLSALAEANEKQQENIALIERNLKKEPGTDIGEKWAQLTNAQQIVNGFEHMGWWGNFINYIFRLFGLKTPMEKAIEKRNKFKLDYDDCVEDYQDVKKEILTKIQTNEAEIEIGTQQSVSLCACLKASRTPTDLDSLIENLNSNLSIHIEDVRAGLISRIEQQTHIGAIKESSASNRIKKVLASFLSTPTTTTLNQLKLVIEKNSAALTDTDLMTLLRDVAEVYEDVGYLLPAESFLPMDIEKQMAYYDSTIEKNRALLKTLKSEKRALLPSLTENRDKLQKYEEKCQEGLLSLKEGYVLIITLLTLSKQPNMSDQEQDAISIVLKALQFKLDKIKENLPQYILQPVVHKFDEWNLGSEKTMRDFYILLDGDSEENLQKAVQNISELSVITHRTLSSAEDNGSRKISEVGDLLNDLGHNINKLSEPLKGSVLAIYNPAIDRFNELPENACIPLVNEQYLKLKTELNQPLLESIDGFPEVIQAIDNLFVYPDIENRLIFEEISSKELEDADRLSSIVSEQTNKLQTITEEISALQNKDTVLHEEQAQARKRPPGVVFNPEAIKKLIDACREFTLQHADIRVALKNFLSYPTEHMLQKLNTAMMDDLGYLKSQKILGLITEASEAYPQIATLHAKALQKTGQEISKQDTYKITLDTMRDPPEDNANSTKNSTP